MSRSTKKGPYVESSLLKKVENAQRKKSREAIKTWSRRSVISPEFVGLHLAVHNGKSFVEILVTENMVGHKLGEFALTRTFRMHSGQRKSGMKAQEK